MVDAVDKEVWTTENDDNGNETQISRVSTASINGKATKPLGASTNMVGVQSKFRRKYFHKAIFIVLTVIIVLLLIAIIVMAVYYKFVETACETKNCVRAATNLLQSMDTSVDPCEDFYRFTCGNWAEDHPRPDNVNSYDWFNEKQTKVLRKIRSVLQKNGTEDEPKAVAQSRFMFKACMNASAMDALGLQPVFDYLAEFALPSYPRILNITEAPPNITAALANYTFDWIRTITNVKRILKSDLLVGFDIFPDPKNRTIKRLAIGAPETGLMLPFKTDVEKRLDKMKRKRLGRMRLQEDPNDEDSDEDDEDDAEVRAAYIKYMTEVISALIFYVNPKVDLEKTVPDIEKVAAITMRIEKALFTIIEEMDNSTETDPENPMANLQVLNLTQLQNATDRLIAPDSIPIWKTYLTYLFNDFPQARLDLSQDIILTSTEDIFYLERFVELLHETPALELELHLWWTIVEDLVLHTTSDIRKLHNDYMKTVTNLEGGTSRSIYCTGGVNQMLGMAVSYAIVDQEFLNHTKPKVMTMLNNIRESFNQMVRHTNWMDDGTKCATLEKSTAMRSQIGFPEWLTEEGKLDEYYEGVNLSETTHLKNLIDVLRRDMAKQLRRFHEVEDFEWATSPTNVNAFHTFQENAITVPLAILQYPFYDLGLEALNYGAIGTILGHELTHGFDDNGRMFDKDGNMRQWWTNKTITEYVNRTNCFIKQYGSFYLPEVSENINGELTLGENIADNGGLREAFHAYQLYVKQNGKEPRLPGLENYTNDQLFFMSYGNLWCETQTITSIRWALEDSHCPGKFRLKGTLTNSPEFSETFGCKVGSAMRPADQCRLW